MEKKRTNQPFAIITSFDTVSSTHQLLQEKRCARQHQSLRSMILLPATQVALAISYAQYLFMI